MEKKSQIIKSSRTFGLEIECGHKSNSYFNNLYDNFNQWLRVTTDSSVTVTNGKEIVTNVLSGTRGGDKVVSLCSYLTEHEFITDDISCGLHLHLDGREFQNEKAYFVFKEDADSLEKVLTVKGDEINTLFKVAKNCVPKPTTQNFIRVVETIVNNVQIKHTVTELPNFGGNPTIMIKKLVGAQEYPVYETSTVDPYDHQIARLVRDKGENNLQERQKQLRGKIRSPEQDKKAKLWAEEKRDEVRKNYKERLVGLMNMRGSRYVAMIDNKKPVERLKSLMYFYILFNDVFKGMVSTSRKDGNAYCMPISDFFTIEQVVAVKKYEDFEKLWYKNDNDGHIRQFKEDHYNDSRYLDFNFHSLWNRTGTIEMRSHGSTKNANQILLWTALHQHIVDSVVAQKVTVEILQEACKMTDSVSDKYQAMNSCLELPVELQTYVKRLLRHFSEINID